MSSAIARSRSTGAVLEAGPRLDIREQALVGAVVLARVEEEALARLDGPQLCGVLLEDAGAMVGLETGSRTLGTSSRI